MLTETAVKKYINECKDFYHVVDFRREILNWKFNVPHPKNLIFNIGHPRSAHKGSSVGDILPYTQLPEIIKTIYPNSSKVTVPEWFTPMFRNNPYVDDFNGTICRYGSLGTWGSTVQRTCNVWGFRTFKFAPKVYSSVNIKRSNSLLFCINSKTGGRIKNLKLFEDIIDHLKTKYHCVQLAVSTDNLVRSANEYIFNVEIDKLINIVSQFDIYLGAQNSIYHLSKALGLDVIGVLPDIVNPKLVILPLLTQINHLEIEMLPKDETKRCDKFKTFLSHDLMVNPNETSVMGWLYPDVCHLTECNVGTDRCPILSIENIELALNKKIYPYGDERLWKLDKYSSLWI